MIVLFLLLQAWICPLAVQAQAPAAAKPAPQSKPVSQPKPPSPAPVAVGAVGTVPRVPTPATAATQPLPKETETEEEEQDVEEEPAVTLPAPRGNALARQAASVQKQLGRARAGSGFFISSWYSDAPPAESFASPVSSAAHAPENCEALDAAVAEAYIRDSAKREGVSTDLIREVVRKESGFNPCAVSPKGAMGMMQLTSETAASLGVDDPFDPRQNIDGGVRLLKRLIDKYKGRPDLALAAYNAGEGAVDANQAVPAYEETQEYVSTIMKRVFEEPLKSSAPGASPAIPSVAPIANPAPSPSKPPGPSGP